MNLPLLTLWIRLASSSQRSAYFCFPGTDIKGVYHNAQPYSLFYFILAFVFWLLTRHHRGEFHTQKYIHHFKPSASATLVLLHSPQICSHHSTFKHHKYYTVNTITQWSQKCMPNLAHHVFHSYTRRNTYKTQRIWYLFSKSQLWKNFFPEEKCYVFKWSVESDQKDTEGVAEWQSVCLACLRTWTSSRKKIYGKTREIAQQLRALWGPMPSSGLSWHLVNIHKYRQKHIQSKNK